VINAINFNTLIAGFALYPEYPLVAITSLRLTARIPDRNDLQG
jgi:hypothetical protein